MIDTDASLAVLRPTRRAVLFCSLGGALSCLPAGHPVLASAEHPLRALQELADLFRQDPSRAFAEARNQRQRRATDVAPEDATFVEAPGSGTTPVDEALARAYRVSDVVVLPQGNWLMEMGSVPAGKTLRGPGTLVLTSEAATLTLGAGALVDGVTFYAPRQQGSILTIPGASAGVTVSGCSFSALGYGVGIRLRPGVREAQILDCSQSGGESLVYAEASQSAVVKRNVVANAARALQFFGGVRNTIEDNIILGGIAGILFLSNRALGNGNVAIENRISGNWVLLTKEEGISFDCHGNKPEKWPEYGRDPVLKILSRKQDAIQISRKEPSETVPPGVMLVLLSGNASGKYTRVVSSIDDMIKVSDSDFVQSVSPGDYAVLTSGFFRNRVISNLVYSAGTYGIGLWGSSWDSEISDNTISDSYSGILVASVVGSGSNSVKAFSGNIRIIHNVVIIGPTKHNPSWIKRGAIVTYTHFFGHSKDESFNTLVKVDDVKNTVR